MALSGSLVDFPLEGVLRLLETTHKSGFLEISGESELGVLEVMEGRLTGARYGEEGGDDALGVIFAMGSGIFSFRTGMPTARNLAGDLDAILERAAAERQRVLAIRSAIPSDDMRFALSERALAGGTITIKPEHWRVLLNVDGRRDVGAIAKVVGRGRLATLRQLNELLEAGLVDALEPAPEPEPEMAPPAAPEPAPAPPRWETAAPEPAAARAFEAPPVFEPAPPPPPVFEAPPAPAFEAPPRPVFEAPPQPAFEPPPAPPPAAEAPPAPPSDDLAAMLQARLAAIETPAPFAPAEAPPTPQDFWSQQMTAPAAPPPVAEPAPPAAEPAADDRLAALFGGATTMEPTTMEPPAPPVAEPPGISHYLPADATAPILEAEAPAAVKPEKKRGLFGFGRKKAEAAPEAAAVAPAPGVASSPGRLASFANALMTEYNSGQYGKGRLDERMHVRLRIVDEQADPLDRMLPVQDDRLDVAAIDRDFAPEQAGPYLATLVRQIFEDAERVFGKDKAKKGYKAAVKNALGGDESVLHDRALAPVLPRV